MSTRRHSRPTARRRTPARRYATYSLYRRQLRIEPLEDRRLLAVIVDTPSDTTNPNDGLTTLREAISATNLAAGADTIQFASTLTVSGPAKIVLTQGELKITDSLTIEGPGATLLTVEASAGARIFNADDGQPLNQDVSISGLTLTKSNTSAEGGAVYSRESLTLADITVDKNTSVGAIRAILGDGAHATISHSIVSNNTGGGIWINSAATSVVQVEQTQVLNNATTGSGGGMLFNSSAGSVSIIDCDIRENSSTAAPGSNVLGGGGIAFTGSGNLSISHSLIASNSALRGGGGIHLRPSSNSVFSLSDCELSNNEALYGGGISIEAQLLSASTHSMVSCQIYGNVTSGFSSTPERGRGGGIHVTGPVPLYLGDLILRENEAQNGGGIFVGGSGDLLIERCSAINNVASSSGGGLVAARVGTVRQSTFSGNTATTGGAISSGSLAIEYSTIANNLATGNGGGISLSSGILSVDQSIVAENSGPAASKDIGRAAGTLVVANFSIIGDNAGSGLAESPFGTTDGRGNRIGGPMFGPIDPLLRPLADYGGTTRTHALAPGSPAIDAGNPAAVAGIGGVPQYDQRGEPFIRVFDGRIDIGAFEFQTTVPAELVVDILVDESDGNYAPGDLSLREAAQLANLAPDTNTIQFSSALTAGGPAILILTRGAVELVGSVSIIGPGADLLTIDASGGDPTPGVADGEGSGIFIIGDDDEELLDAQISGLTLTGGDAQYGGAILSTENLTLQNCTITGNYAGQLGGGVAVLYGDVVIDNCLITNNDTDETTATGGGIAASSAASLVITDSTISDNVSAVGGGIHTYDTPLSVLDCTIANNVALGQGGSGGGIYHKGGELVVADSTISGNTSISGGGIYSDTDATLTGVSLHGNYAYFHGGAVYSFGKLRIRESTITANSAALDGGGIRAAGDIQIEGSALEENEAGRWGGAAWIDVVDGPLTITTSTLRGNSATNEGGALWVTGVDATATVTHSTIAENGTSQIFGFGGGITIRNVTLLVQNSTVSGNSANTGGGFYADDSALSIIDSSVESNSAVGFNSAGGGIYQTFGTLTIDRSIVSENSAKTGGGIYASAQLALTHTTIRDNVADLDGGGIFAAGVANIDSSLLNNNTASRSGGAIAAETDDVTIVNSTLSGNSAGALGGGLWAAEPVGIRHSTFFENQAGVAGGGIFLISGSLPLNHTIVARNVAPAGPDLTGLLGASFSPRYSLIGSNAGSGLAAAPVGAPDSHGNMIGGNIDPLLGPLAENGGITLTHALLPGSPAIDAGDPAAVAGMGAVPMFDQRGDPYRRVFDGEGAGGARIDIGAFELIPNDVVHALLGDYNRNGVVDAADFVLWRKTLTSGVVPPFSGADGDGDGTIDQDDHGVWRAHFGRTATGVGSGAAAPAFRQAASEDVGKAAVPAGEETTATSIRPNREAALDAGLASFDARATPHVAVFRPRGRMNILRAVESGADHLLPLAIDRLRLSPREDVFAVGEPGRDDLDADKAVDESVDDEWVALALAEWKSVYPAFS